MRHTIRVRTIAGDKTYDVDIHRHPDVCPWCHDKVQPVYLVGVLRREALGSTLVSAAYLCPGLGCSSMFLASFRSARGTDGVYELLGVAPWAAKPQEFAAEVSQVSPRFVQAHNSATAAEQAGIVDLVGMGLRRALEFLIKDYAISTRPDDAAAIRGMPLGEVITTYCKDERLRKAARRATWLGNDETHYERIWGDKDVEDLKVLVRLTVGWVEAEILTQKYVEEMPERGRGS